MTIYLIIGLIAIGLFAVVRCDNIIRKLIGLSFFNTGVIILFVFYGARSGTQAPILLETVVDIVDPVPQALMLTDIVIGVSVTALALVLAVRIYRSFGTLSMREIEKKGAEWDG